MTTRRSGAAFETVIERHLLGASYVAASARSYDRERAFCPDVVRAVIPTGSGSIKPGLRLP